MAPHGVGGRVANPLEFMDPDRMTDAGMYTWAALLAVATLAASYGVAVWWQKRKAKPREP